MAFEQNRSYKFLHFLDTVLKTGVFFPFFLFFYYYYFFIFPLGSALRTLRFRNIN